MREKPVRSLSDLLAELRRERQRYANAIIDGAVRNFDEYRHSVGVISGLDTAERLLTALLESQQDDDLDPPP